MPGTSVSEIHRYPPRPEGFEEPLFPTRESRLAVAEHLLRAPWLMRASELGTRAGEPVEVRRGRAGIEVAWAPRAGCGRRRGRSWRRVVEVLDRWREVRGWWGEEGVDRRVYRVLLAGGVIADLARERGPSGGWLLVGVAD
ncbi:hypothetical protein Rxyl_1921 [Rubrobacter xylanophilus DSM 9941]|uniref:DUF6504 domain-containing protein n=1 Tax=Rubrobacter xylanophilus (strain DSM 9941 / JCM 11954 / NBRC 16129 / PRD-1) TaxID=266117 RepID=Q1AUR0_RUBXD|nr:DUF6504 family protein [Rubrobacter xylanophilus]ABG04868.1 hypothetical protein Rxyl_1921 [Rubrobacter xylanophilus DSM 9941]